MKDIERLYSRTTLVCQLVGVLFLSVFGYLTVADERTAPQEQASALAVPEQEARVVSAVLVTHCNRALALVFADEHGGLHWTDIEGRSVAEVMTILGAVPADKVKQIQVPCGSKDGFVL